MKTALVAHANWDNAECGFPRDDQVGRPDDDGSYALAAPRSNRHVLAVSPSVAGPHTDHTLDVMGLREAVGRALS